MKLIKFTPDNANSYRSNESFIRFHGGGVITISPGAVEKIGLKIGDSVFIAQDEDNPEDWYLVKGGDDSFKLRQYKGNPALCFNNAFIAKELIKFLDINTNSVSLKLATEKTENEDEEESNSEIELYAIIIKTARYRELASEEEEEEEVAEQD